MYMNMADWMSYAYCEKCDRPLRENEVRSETMHRKGGGETIYSCRLFNSRARKPNRLIRVIDLGAGTLWLIGGAAWYFFVKGHGHRAGRSTSYSLFDAPVHNTRFFCSGLVVEVQRQTHLRTLGPSAWH